MGWRYYATSIYIVTSVAVICTFAGLVMYNVWCVQHGESVFQMVAGDEEENETMLEMAKSDEMREETLESLDSKE